MVNWEERRFPSGADGPWERARLAREAGVRLSDDDMVSPQLQASRRQASKTMQVIDSTGINTCDRFSHVAGRGQSEAKR